MLNRVMHGSVGDYLMQDLPGSKIFKTGTWEGAGLGSSKLHYITMGNTETKKVEKSIYLYIATNLV